MPNLNTEDLADRLMEAIVFQMEQPRLPVQIIRTRMKIYLLFPGQFLLGYSEAKYSDQFIAASEFLRITS